MSDSRITWLIQSFILVISLFPIGNVAFAASLSTNTLTYGTAVDGGQSYGWVIDGSFDAITTSANPILGTTTLYVTKSQGSDLVHQIERRAIFEFAVPSLLKQNGVTITKATLSLPQAPYGSSTLANTNELVVYGYSGDGQVSLTDFGNVATPIWSIVNAAPPFLVDATPFVQSAVGGVSHFGFLLAVSTWDTAYELDSGAGLTIEYTAPPTSPVNQPPSVDITAPANNVQVAVGTTVTFQGTAIDPENAGVSAITWTSSISGIIGTGPSLATSALPIGNHTITAKATDSSGLTGQMSITVSVINNTTYCDARGLSASYEWINAVTLGTWSNNSGSNSGYGNFVNSTVRNVVIGVSNVTLVPGFSSTSYNEYWRIWIDLNRDLIFSDNELLFSGSGVSLLSGSLTVPSTTLTGPARMRVGMSYGNPAAACGSFSYGEVEDYSINIVAPTVPTPAPAPAPSPAPTPASYCVSKGSNATYEWINQITLSYVPRITGSNNGYGDFTTTASIPLVYGTNPLTLYPGMSAQYVEYWRVWIDFDQDRIFSNSEIVYSGSSYAPISASISVPTTAKLGTTRMRVSMKYGALPGACEVFSYGEVEDYAVMIH